MATWDFITQTRGGGSKLANLTDLGERKLNLFLNQPGDASGVMDLLSPQCRRAWLEPGVHELVALRDGEAIETVFQLATAEPQLDTEGGGTIGFGWLGIMSYLSNGFVGPAYVQVAAAQNVAAWNLVATFQAKANAATYGIIDGADTPGQPLKSLELPEEKDVKEAVSDLAAREDGFDFWVDTLGAFQTAYPGRGTDLTRAVVYEHGSNCTVSNLQEDASPGAIVNWVRVKGGNSASAVAENVASQLKYGRREAVVSYTDELDVARLQQYANVIVARRSAPTVVPVVQVDTEHPRFTFAEAWLGDTVRLVAQVGNYMGIDADYRVVAVHLELDEEDNEAVSLELNAV